MAIPQPDITDFDKVNHAFRLALTASAVVLAIGTVFYHLVEHLTWLDAVYFCVITLTTIGYGDIAPHTAAGKLFTICYILVGIGIVATLLNLTVQRAVAKRRNK